MTCKTCGGELYPYQGKKKCRFCGNIWEDESGAPADLAIRGGYDLLRAADFAGAERAFANVLSADPDCYEAMMGIAYAHGKIVYVESETSAERIPTCFESKPRSIGEDPYYRNAVRLAPEEIAAVYVREERRLSDVAKLYAETKAPEYDLFLCYKETANGSRTADSDKMLALYEKLTWQGYRVFFARISLQGHYGENYEVCIRHALNSAKVMLVYASDPTYYNTKWLRNEWSRWKYAISLGEKRANSLVVAFDGFDPALIPADLQAPQIQAANAAEAEFFESLKNHLAKFGVAAGRTRIVPEAEGGKQTAEQRVALAKKPIGKGVFLPEGGLRSPVMRKERAAVPLTKDVSDQLRLAEGLKASGYFRKALSLYDAVLEEEDNASARIGRLFALAEARSGQEFVLNAPSFRHFEEFDKIADIAAQAEFEGIAFLFFQAEKLCFEQGETAQGLRFFECVSRYESRCRFAALALVKDRLVSEIDGGKERRIEPLLAACLDAEEGVVHASYLVDRLIARGKWALAASVNERIRSAAPDLELGAYHAMRIRRRTPLRALTDLIYREGYLTEQEEDLTPLLSMEDLSEIESVLAKVGSESALAFNGLISDAVLLGIARRKEGKNLRFGENIAKLIALLSAYDFPCYVLQGRRMESSTGLFSLYRAYLSLSGRAARSTEEILSLLHAVTERIPRENTDEYAAYQIVTAETLLERGERAAAKERYEVALRLLPADLALRYLSLCCDYAAKADFRSLVEGLGRAAQTKDGDVAAEIGGLLAYADREKMVREESCAFLLSFGETDSESAYGKMKKRRAEPSGVVSPVLATNAPLRRVDSLYERELTLFTDAWLDLCDRTLNRRAFAALVEVYDRILLFTPEENASLMTERLKSMADYLLYEEEFSAAERFYSYAIGESGKDAALYFGRMMARAHCSSEAELLVCVRDLDRDADMDEALLHAKGAQQRNYIGVAEKRTLLRKDRAGRKALSAAKKRFS
ncbi:MAG: hypothetical protein ACI4U2_04755, partial [Christensenellaceae bacterium]